MEYDKSVLSAIIDQIQERPLEAVITVLGGVLAFFMLAIIASILDSALR